MRLKTGTFLSPSIYTVDAIICIINPRLVSQAGRRRFDPGLPLQLSRRGQVGLEPPQVSDS
jgi:hypothetical protein